MSAKKNTPTNSAKLAGARGMGTASRQATTSNDHDTTRTPPGQAVHIADFLSTGVAYAVTLRDLVALTGRNERDVRREIEAERRCGTPILSNSRDGYWIGESQDEIAQFVRDMKRRARQIRLTADAVGKAAGIGK